MSIVPSIDACGVSDRRRPVRPGQRPPGRVPGVAGVWSGVVGVVGRLAGRRPAPAGPGPAPAQVARRRQAAAVRRRRLMYAPGLDGQADPGGVVWTWVPYEDDPRPGKDRPR